MNKSNEQSRHRPWHEKKSLHLDLCDDLFGRNRFSCALRDVTSLTLTRAAATPRPCP